MAVGLGRYFGDALVTYQPFLKTAGAQKIAWEVQPEEAVDFESFAQLLAPHQVWEAAHNANDARRLYLGANPMWRASEGEPRKSFMDDAAWMDHFPTSDSEMIWGCNLWMVDFPMKLAGTWKPKAASLELQQPIRLADLGKRAWEMGHPLYHEQKRQLMGPRNRQQRNLPHPNTKFHYDATTGGAAIRLHATDVVTFFPTYILLDTGGWHTLTTHKRMNQILQNIPVRVSGAGGGTTLYSHDTPTLINGDKVLIDYDGNVLANGYDAVEAYMDAYPPQPTEEM